MPGLSYQDLQTARNTANAATNQYMSMAANADQLQAELTDAVKAKFADIEKPLISAKNQAESNYLYGNDVARAKYSDPNSANYIFDPHQQESLVAQDRANNYKQYADLTDYYNLAVPKMNDITNRAMAGYNAKMGAVKGMADLARQNYSDLLNEYKVNAQYGNQGNIGSMISAYLPQFLNGNNTENDPRQALGMIALMSAKSPSDVLAATNLLYPKEGTTQTQQKQKQEAWSNLKQRINEALGLIDTGKNVSGWAPLEGLRKSIGLFGGISPERAQMEQLLADITSGQAFGTAGKALTETEKKLISGKIPQASYDEKYLKDQLLSILSDVDNQININRQMQGLPTADDIATQYGF